MRALDAQDWPEAEKNFINALHVSTWRREEKGRVGRDQAGSESLLEWGVESRRWVCESVS